MGNQESQRTHPVHHFCAPRLIPVRLTLLAGKSLLGYGAYRKSGVVMRENSGGHIGDIVAF